jgi:hypothetical protein
MSHNNKNKEQEEEEVIEEQQDKKRQKMMQEEDFDVTQCGFSDDYDEYDDDNKYDNETLSITSDVKENDDDEEQEEEFTAWQEPIPFSPIPTKTTTVLTYPHDEETNIFPFALQNEEEQEKQEQQEEHYEEAQSRHDSDYVISEEEDTTITTTPTMTKKINASTGYLN